MKRLAVVTGVFFFAFVLLLSCGGGGDESLLGNLQGTWLGWIEDDGGVISEFSLQIDGDGNILDVKIGGKSTGITGSINDDWDENLFWLNYSSNRNGGIMIVDSQYSHATYGDHGVSGFTDYSLGMLEKGAVNLPAHAESEIVQSYPVGGAYIFTDDSGIYNWVGDNITMTVNPDLTFSGSVTSEGNFSGSFQNFESNHGQYAGTFTRSTDPPLTMDITAYISPDGTAVSAFASESGTVPASLYDFILMGFKK